MLQESYIQAKHTRYADSESKSINAHSEALRRRFIGIVLSIVTGLLCGLLVTQLVTPSYALAWAFLTAYCVMSSMILLTLAD